jgi:prepilin-type N-terminal cleavage/methylation domain-containing protein
MLGDSRLNVTTDEPVVTSKRIAVAEFSSRDQGFTLVEVLVVMLLIATLAAIAIPVFLRRRDNAHVAGPRSALKNAATAAEGYATANDGDFSGLDGDHGALLAAQGFKRSPGVTVSVAADGDRYCVTDSHANLPAGHDWKISTYNSAHGSPSPTDVDACGPP